jgi:hypothetical protein
MARVERLGLSVPQLKATTTFSFMLASFHFKRALLKNGVMRKDGFVSGICQPSR